jgi:hypothetical protein
MGEVREEVFRRQAAEVTRLRADASGRLATAEAALERSEATQDRARDVQAAIGSVRARVRRATAQDWRRLVEALFPRQEGVSIRMHPDGRIETSGVLRLG